MLALLLLGSPRPSAADCDLSRAPCTVGICVGWTVACDGDCFAAVDLAVADGGARAFLAPAQGTCAIETYLAQFCNSSGAFARCRETVSFRGGGWYSVAVLNTGPAKPIVISGSVALGFRSGPGGTAGAASALADAVAASALADAAAVVGRGLCAAAVAVVGCGLCAAAVVCVALRALQCCGLWRPPSGACAPQDGGRAPRQAELIGGPQGGAPGGPASGREAAAGPLWGA